MKRIAFIIIFLWWGVLHAQPPRSYTSSEILLQLKKLNTVGSVLYIAAHPDDENTRLIAYLANEKCLRTGYLSLTRGDGGQNLIGPEQGVELGVIRTQELLAARRIDGGEQFFTRAYDFGYSKTPEETFKKWNKDSVLSDVVWVIRNFRPDIIITRFATDGSGGHGHHTASAILAEEAFDAAGDPKRFPEQLQYVDVWQPRRLFYNATNRFRDPNADMSAFIKLDVGGYNPLLGKSYGEIAAESRSMHKSQGFGSAKQRGEYFEYFKPVKGDTAGLKDIFERMDFTWKRVKGGEKIEKLLNSIIKKFEPLYPEKSVPDLIKLRNLRTYPGGVNKLIGLCLGIYSESTIEKSSFVSAYDSFVVKTTFVNRSKKPVHLSLIRFIDVEGSMRSEKHRDINVTVPPDSVFIKYSPLYNECYQIFSQKFWLKNPVKNSLFSTQDKRSALSLNPDGYLLMPVMGIYYSIGDGKEGLSFVNDLLFKKVEPDKGEMYEPVIFTPPLSFEFENNTYLATDSNNIVPVIVKVKALKDGVQSLVQIVQNVASRWETYNLSFEKKGEEKTIVFHAKALETIDTLLVDAHVNGAECNWSLKRLEYDHFPAQTLIFPAEAKLIRLDVKKNLKRIGYIPGAGDEVAPCLTQLGYEVVTLTDDVLAKENLSQFEAILTGVRAYNTNEKLPSFKQKLMDYVANGGNLIVQYNTNSWAGPLSSDIGPYKFKITRDRITDEEAKVNFELPNHPVLNAPNKITDKDFEGWIQERSIYHAGDWDSNYVAPLSMADPGEKNNKGALIVAKHGKGHFVYSGLVFFRQLPAGVPGAYRLLVNMIELGK